MPILTSFLLFIGTPRSGHSVVGAILDAHPDAAIAHERDALALIAGGASGPALIAALITTSRAQAAGRGQGGGDRGYRFDYALPGQGRIRGAPRVVGDKLGGGTTTLLGRQPALLERLRAAVGCPLRVLHVTRHPADNVATISRRRAIPLPEAIAVYARYCADLARVRRDLLRPGELMTLRHEALLTRPRPALRRLAAHLGLAPDPSWIEAGCGLLYDRPRRSRAEIAWSVDDAAALRAARDRADWLADYE